jgi:hypothetical protein
MRKKYLYRYDNCHRLRKREVKADDILEDCEREDGEFKGLFRISYGSFCSFHGYRSYRGAREEEIQNIKDQIKTLKKHLSKFKRR